MRRKGNCYRDISRGSVGDSIVVLVKFSVCCDDFFYY